MISLATNGHATQNRIASAVTPKAKADPKPKPRMSTDPNVAVMHPDHPAMHPVELRPDEFLGFTVEPVGPGFDFEDGPIVHTETIFGDAYGAALYLGRLQGGAKALHDDERRGEQDVRRIAYRYID